MSTTATTYCRICEATCGLVATIDDGRIVKMASDPDHVTSHGYFCVKGPAMVEVTYDPDRVLTPLRRVGAPGQFEPCSWDEALADITARIAAVRAQYGADAFANLIGNPPYHCAGTMLFLPMFQTAMQIRNRYSVNSEDGAARLVASYLLYGSPLLMPKPDLWRTNFAIVIGSNPIVAKGSTFTEPRMREALDAIVERGGRVVVIDPRRTETAKRFEHIAVRPGTDAWLLAGMARTILDEGLADNAFIAAHTTGLNDLISALAPFDLATCARHCDVPVATIATLARDLASATSGHIIGRTGTCTQQFGTLTNALQDIVTILTGNFDREGGLLLGWGLFANAALEASGDTYASFHSRADNLPEVWGYLPSHALVGDICKPGEGQVRALISIGSNAVVTSGAGAGPKLAHSLEQLDIHVSLDIYMNETNKHADYILPAPTMFERGDFPIMTQAVMLRPALWATRALITPIGDTREEWTVLADLATRLGAGASFFAGDTPLTPKTIVDGMLAASARPDLSFETLVAEYPHGVALRPDLPTGNYLAALKTPDQRICLLHPELRQELTLLRDHVAPEGFPLRVIGMRELSSMNSWMHNVEPLMPKRRHYAARVNPANAADAGINSGDLCEITSVQGTIRVTAQLTDDVPPGTIALPHGWGHAGGWQRANASDGANSNLLASYRREDIERLAGMSVLNGIPVRLSRIV